MMLLLVKKILKVFRDTVRDKNDASVNTKYHGSSPSLLVLNSRVGGYMRLVRTAVGTVRIEPEDVLSLLLKTISSGMELTNVESFCCLVTKGESLNCNKKNEH